ncbi:MAG: hypothetical protein IJR29_08305 [Butyrivibrio sp.]|nr:hypothetical protein [Butyrivibrio sp.]
MMVMENKMFYEMQKSKDRELRRDGMEGNHAEFNLKSSDSKPFDSERMSGRPSGSNNNSITNDSSGTPNKAK